MTVNSTSPLAAPIKIVNLSQTPSSIPNRLLSARVFRKFFTVSPLSRPPVCRCNSWIIWDLSLDVSVGAVRIIGSLGSFLKISDSAARAFDVLSNDDNLAAAVY